MKEAWKFLKAIAPALIILTLGLGLTWLFVRETIRLIGSLESEVATSIIAAAIAALVGLVTVVYNQRRAKDREIAESHRPQKVRVYGDYMEMMFDLLQRTNEGKTISKSDPPKDLFKKMYNFRRDVILWGSPGVIRAYLDWEKVATADQAKGIIAWDRMLREFRKDLGNSNWMLSEGQLLSVILTQDARSKLIP